MSASATHVPSSDMFIRIRGEVQAFKKLIDESRDEASGHGQNLVRDTQKISAPEEENFRLQTRCMKFSWHIRQYV